jgi:hypothetical protein
MFGCHFQIESNEPELPCLLDDSPQQCLANTAFAMLGREIELLQPSCPSTVFNTGKRGHVSDTDDIGPGSRDKEKSVMLISQNVRHVPEAALREAEANMRR